MEKKITIAIIENEIEDAKVLEKHIQDFFLEKRIYNQKCAILVVYS
jgi:hypothetical protein